MSVSQTIGRHNKLLIGTALVGAFLSSYARRTYAGSCMGVGGVFTCSGPASVPAGTDTTQTLSGTPLTVTTAAGFGITTAVGDAFSLTGTNGLTFIDPHSSTITGATNGITAFNQGSGALSITTTGLVTGVGTAPQNAGIYAYNSGTDLIIHAAGVSGGYDGIRAFNNGSGELSITTTGQVTVAGPATYSGGILAFNSPSGTDLTIDAAGVSGGADGISGANFGSGALSITTTGPVTGTGTATSNAGIVAYNAGTYLTITAAEVSGGHNGIFAYNNGSGILSITTTGAVTGANADGIYASNSGTELTIEAADVSGSYRGIDARNLGSGALSITATGAVTVNTPGVNTTGIYAYNGINGTDLTIHAAAVSGGADGISAANFGSGALSITTTGLVTGSGTAPNNGGIVAYNFIYGTNLNIAAANVSGGSYGIFGQNFGSGALSITATGTVTGAGTATSNAGIYAYNTGTDLTIHAAGVSGGYDGIRAFNNGSGALSITTTGLVTGSGAATYNGGILAFNNTSSTDLTIDAADVTGGADGISAANFGSGALSITTTGSVTGTGTATSNAGIVAYNCSATNLTIAAADVSGGDNGICRLQQRQRHPVDHHDRCGEGLWPLRYLHHQQRHRHADPHCRWGDRLCCWRERWHQCRFKRRPADRDHQCRHESATWLQRQQPWPYPRSMDRPRSPTTVLCSEPSNSATWTTVSTTPRRPHGTPQAVPTTSEPATTLSTMTAWLWRQPMPERPRRRHSPISRLFLTTPAAS